MFSSSSNVSMVELLDSCSSIDPVSTPNYSAATKSLTASTPKNVKVSNTEPSHLSTPSPSNIIQPSVPSTHSSAFALTPVTHNLCSKRKALFVLQRRFWRELTCFKNKTANHLPFPDQFSLRKEKAISSNQMLSVRKQLISDIGVFCFAFNKHLLQGDYK